MSRWFWFFSFPNRDFAFEPSRLCRHPSIRTLCERFIARCYVGASCGGPTHRPGCHGGVGSEFELVAQQTVQDAIVHKEHHDVGRRTPARAISRVGRIRPFNSLCKQFTRCPNRASDARLKSGAKEEEKKCAVRFFTFVPDGYRHMSNGSNFAKL